MLDRKKSRTLLCSALAALGTAMAMPGGASAHNPWPSQPCPSGVLCVWIDQDYNSSRGDLAGTNAVWSGAWSITNNDESSANNGTSGLAVSIWTGNSYTGARSSCLARGQANGHHNPLNGGNSNKWQSAC
jgi:hypothetical protein